MKYFINKNGGLEREGKGSCICPPAALEGYCGDWCPLFAVGPASFTEYRRERKVIVLHCGAGTRTIEIERDERREER